ncbi:MAG: hypothetical protein ACYC9J_00410 [Sulfuricaulis sp.]
MTATAQIVARRENRPPNLPRKTQVCKSVASEFYDAPHWDELAAKHLSRYTLPAWDVPCDPEAMRRWLGRLDLTERQYEKLTATSLDDFITLNRCWPLRAWIGLMLEAKQEAER